VHVPREVNRAVVKSERTETTLRRGIAHGERERGGREGGGRGEGEKRGCYRHSTPLFRLANETAIRCDQIIEN